MKFSRNELGGKTGESGPSKKKKHRSLEEERAGGKEKYISIVASYSFLVDSLQTSGTLVYNRMRTVFHKGRKRNH